MTKLNKYILFIAALLSIWGSGGSTSIAKEIVVDGSMALATGPGTGMGPTVGYGVGMNLELIEDVIAKSNGRRVVARVDVSYYKWRESEDNVKWSHTSVPVFVGCRFFIPNAPVIYLEGGLEVSFNSYESTYTGPLYGIYGYGYSVNYRSSDLGLDLGLGVEIPMSKDFVVGVSSRLRMGASSSSLGAFVGYKF